MRVIPAAAGGPKGLILNPLDRFIFGQWLPGSTQVVHLVGASIGAWRMAMACQNDSAAGLAQMAEDYITQDYPHPPGRPPTPAQVSAVLSARLHERLQPLAAEVLAHPRFRLHVFTSLGRGLLRREGRFRAPLGYGAAFLANAVHRRALAACLQRVVFGDARQPLPFALDDYPTQHVPLTPENLAASVLASCSIPFQLQAVNDVPGGPPGAYWDGGITDYHLHLPYAGMGEGLVLYPHFQPQVVPGWLDKHWPRRHRATPALDNLVLLSPRPDWVARLPGAKLPDRSDFVAFAQDTPGRIRLWRAAVASAQELADDFAAAVEQGAGLPVLPLP